MLSDINPTLASTDTDAHPEFHIPKVDSIETDDEMAVKVKVGSYLQFIQVVQIQILTQNSLYQKWTPWKQMMEWLSRLR